MKTIKRISWIAIIAVLTCELPGCGGGARQFSTTDFNQSRTWIAEVESNLERVRKQGNDILYIEAIKSAKTQLECLVGKSVTWKLNVSGVGSHGVNFIETEIGTTYFPRQYPEILIALHTSSYDILGNEHLTLPMERMRSLKAGDVLTINGTIISVETRQFPSAKPTITLDSITVN